MMLIGIFSGARRDGIWHAQPRETVVVIFGGAELDYTKAVLPEGSITVNVFSLFGGAKIRVPRGSSITLQGVSLFGGRGVERKGGSLGDPREAKPFFVGGVTVFGGVGVEED